jgi:phosphoribosylformylglycinamidine synthase subunit PurS
VRVTVLVRPKDGIRDPQGEAIDRSLRGLGYPSRSVRAGKVFDLELDASTPDEARAIATTLAERVLANPLIETFALEVEA